MCVCVWSRSTSCTDDLCAMNKLLLLALRIDKRERRREEKETARGRGFDVEEREEEVNEQWRVKEREEGCHNVKPSHANKRKKERQRITRSTSCTDD